MTVKSLFIAPTGDELIAGIIRDGNSPAIAEIAQRSFPGLKTHIHPPVPDRKEAFDAALQAALAFDLALFSGGSGGGRDYDPELTIDCTHKALMDFLDAYAVRDIFGCNGHLWARMVCGQKDGTLFFNVPGPTVEAVAAAAAAFDALAANAGPDGVVDAMIDAVRATYPVRGR